ncbi:hypothetical protein SORBI_3004G357033 [Sorghum bicolor]|uniref:Uncharacterized protein n=1 Tax=Sorghum bicolor TaxID=4558 RepID=A0A1Z5RR05_SORBI|nr:hypothetical protein SORBI_3004G357033 [Sorghum bicolor]
MAHGMHRLTLIEGLSCSMQAGRECSTTVTQQQGRLDHHVDMSDDAINDHKQATPIICLPVRLALGQLYMFVCSCP